MSQLAWKVPSGNEATLDDCRAPAWRASVPDDDPAVDGLLLGLESVGRGALVLDRDGCLLGMNGCAEASLGQWAVIRHRRLQGRSPCVSARIDRVVRQALAPGGADAIAALVVPPVSTLVLRAIPLASGACRSSRAKVLLVLTQTGRETLPCAGLLRDAYGLTATEAEVALALAGGATAGTIARDRAVCRETVRSHLKTIYAKTGTKGQASCVAAILRLRDVAPAG